MTAFEVLGGVALLAGLQSSRVASASAPVMLGAVSVHAGHGGVFSAPNGGWQYPLVRALLSVEQILEQGVEGYAVQVAGCAAGQLAPFACRAKGDGEFLGFTKEKCLCGWNFFFGVPTPCRPRGGCACLAGILRHNCAPPPPRVGKRSLLCMLIRHFGAVYALWYDS